MHGYASRPDGSSDSTRAFAARAGGHISSAGRLQGLEQCQRRATSRWNPAPTAASRQEAGPLPSRCGAQTPALARQGDRTITTARATNRRVRGLVCSAPHSTPRWPPSGEAPSLHSRHLRRAAPSHTVEQSRACPSAAREVVAPEAAAPASRGGRRGGPGGRRSGSAGRKAAPRAGSPAVCWSSCTKSCKWYSPSTSTPVSDRSVDDMSLRTATTRRAPRAPTPVSEPGVPSEPPGRATARGRASGGGVARAPAEGLDLLARAVADYDGLVAVRRPLQHNADVARVGARDQPDAVAHLSTRSTRTARGQATKKA